MNYNNNFFLIMDIPGTYYCCSINNLTLLQIAMHWKIALCCVYNNNTDAVNNCASDHCSSKYYVFRTFRCLPCTHLGCDVISISFSLVKTIALIIHCSMYVHTCWQGTLQPDHETIAIKSSAQEKERVGKHNNIYCVFLTLGKILAVGCKLKETVMVLLQF